MAIVAGQVGLAADLTPYVSDTGWVAITPATGFTSGGFAYRLRGGVVYLRGSVTRTAGDFPSSSTSILSDSLPAEVRPAQDSRFPLTTFASATARGAECIVGAAGGISVYGTGASSDVVRFHNVVYPVG